MQNKFINKLKKFIKIRKRKYEKQNLLQSLHNGELKYREYILLKKELENKFIKEDKIK